MQAPAPCILVPCKRAELFTSTKTVAPVPLPLRCIRQTIDKLYKEGDWQAKHGMLYGTRDDVPGDYSKLLMRSRFCLVMPGQCGVLRGGR